MSIKEHREGSAARLAGKPKTDNPYRKLIGMGKALAWDQGWEAADADQREEIGKGNDLNLLAREFMP